ncbi:MAG: dimethyladenosine transferase, rRNA (adenine1518-N6/adenine1519-N6)-dimethyltransferase [Candidatus Parcubacteria bacterium]|jgi:16S rRNA (adenine1518-N6/adenine1519-N6)-dimethyltransferase
MKAKKSLGQHFLKSKRAIAKIISAAQLTTDDVVLEIGPGKGALTKALLESGARVIAIEKDNDMIEVLEQMFASEIESGRLFLIHDDVLMFDPTTHGLQQGRYKLIANIPYYITGEIIRRFLSEVAQPERMVLLVQKEVATRITARDAKESILSLSVKAYGTPKLVMTVPVRDFSPAPKVDSAILSITDISHDRLSSDEEEQFFTIIKQAFSQKRKQLAGTIPPLIPKETLVEFLTQQKLPVTARPEELSFDNWMKLIA